MSTKSAQILTTNYKCSSMNLSENFDTNSLGAGKYQILVDDQIRCTKNNSCSNNNNRKAAMLGHKESMCTHQSKDISNVFTFVTII